VSVSRIRLFMTDRSAPSSPGATLAILCLIATVGLSGSFLYLPALPMMAEGFGASEPAAQVTLTAFLLGSCLGLALHGRAADRFGHRRAFGVAGLIFVAASIVAAGSIVGFGHFTAACGVSALAGWAVLSRMKGETS